MKHFSTKSRPLIWKKSNASECNSGSDPDFWPETLIRVKKLPWNSCFPIRKMSVSAQLSSSLVNIGVFLLNSFGMQKYLHWPCFPTLQRAKEKAGGSVGSNAPSLYCYPSVGLVFRSVCIHLSGSTGDFTGRKLFKEISLSACVWRGQELSARWGGSCGASKLTPGLCCHCCVQSTRLDGAGG